MTRTLLLPLLATLALAPAPAAAGAPPSRLADADWAVRSVSADGRVLTLDTLGGPCGHDPRATVTETATRVRIRVRELAPTDLSAIRCPAPKLRSVRVRLAAPLDWRELVGESPRGPGHRFPLLCGGAPAPGER